MKNINQWMHEFNMDPDPNKTYYSLIKAVQKDAYNQAIEDAAEEAELKEHISGMMSFYEVDKQSILDLKIE